MIVVKLGGRVQSSPELVPALVAWWRAMPGSFCIVHGGGDDVSALQRQLGREPSFVNGRRITSDDDVELVRMVLSGSSNKRLVAELVAAGVTAVGVSGEDGGMIEAEPIDLDAYGRAGKPVGVHTELIDTLLSAGFLPVISPVARDIQSTRGAALNVNGDDAAAAIAAAMQAELWMIADVSGVLDAERRVLESLNSAETETLVTSGVVNRGMHAKLEAGFSALENGAAAVRIAGLEAITKPDSNHGTLLKTSMS
ncbi:MAG TPA: acetylglutamate kinase [Gemmatimonadaceae bacterium]|nr:acetylglutamate kinase [Gemmatimonadaceae bacterium]